MKRLRIFAKTPPCQGFCHVLSFLLTSTHVQEFANGVPNQTIAASTHLPAISSLLFSWVLKRFEKCSIMLLLII